MDFELDLSIESSQTQQSLSIRNRDDIILSESESKNEEILLSEFEEFDTCTFDDIIDDMRTDYDKLYCDGLCGNTFAKYIFGLKHSLTNKVDKSLMIATYFMSFDYALRKALISLLEKHYFIRSKTSQKRTPNNKDNNNEIVAEMLQALENENEYFQKNQLESVRKFESLFTLFIANNKCFILNALCLQSCKRSNDSIPLMEEFIGNSNEIVIDFGYIPIIKQCKTFQKLCDFGFVLTNDEILSLYTFMKHKNEFCAQSISACVWKHFYTNLVNAFHKIYKGLVANEQIEQWQCPNTLFCDTKQIQIGKGQNSNALTVNSITHWSSNKLLCHSKGGKLLQLNNAKKLLFVNRNIIRAVPIHWVLPSNSVNNTKEIDEWLLLPFQSQFVINRNDTNLFELNVAQNV